MRYAALLRGVNVGGRSKLAMADLRRIVEGCGYADVQTYVQSGNVVFTAKGSAKAIAGAIRTAIAADTSLDPAVAVRSAAQLAKVVERCPYDDTDHVHVTFLVDGATAAKPSIEVERFAPEAFAVRAREVYLYLPDGIGRSKLAQALGKGGTAADGTTRNWRTVTKLLELTCQ